MVTGPPDTLDAIASDLPDGDAPYIGPEYDGPPRLTPDDDPTLSDGEERLTARVSFVSDTVEADGTTYDGSAEATALFDALTSHDLPKDATVRHYRSPTGGVTSAEVQAWYEAHPDEQPVNDDGEAFVPSSWDPSRHVVSEF
ncbi:hypothetical protein C453_12691 [Haloferax elongans ATCC BAA-1513]|uniref:Uncharacterized protein n=1 Tax=Haloferax elongans ATCC BAA-1513 TaxID=1230453 RepID=M0HKS8_HALEO|nr:hypothetical protein [Haloferax elongans]ELZ84403.1 hypothetical protein C453_12691 [Haloferax elongans ATCC BAA-1513]